MIRKRLVFVSLLGVFLGISPIFAGTILSAKKYAWSDKVGYINFENVIVNTDSLSGYGWSENAGWINFNPNQGGVIQDGNGNLSGSAWGEKLGWIDFDNVTINTTTGKFSGTATGLLVGTITFDCPNYCDVRTDWRPDDTPTTCTSWTYSSWSTCSSGQQTRTIISSSPTDCTGGSPVLNQICSLQGGGGIPRAVEKNRTIPNPDCSLTSSQTFKEFKDYLVCENLITKREVEKEYEYQKYAPRKEVLGVAVSMFLKNTLSKTTHTKDMTLYRAPYFLDVGLPGDPEWIVQAIEKGIMFNIISPANSLFRPDDTITRSEAFAMMMKAVCMNPSGDISLPWEQRVHTTAKKNGITVRSWEDFMPKSPVLRQDFFVLSTQLDRWAESTGGCNTKSIKPPQTTLPKNNPVPSVSATTASPQPTLTPQRPGSFTLLYENAQEKVFAYIVRSGGIPDGVRLQYLNTFGEPRKVAEKLFIRDIAGTEFAENRWLLAGEIVYVYLSKE